ncbi:MAG: hypothetical protein RLZ98_2291 [Pseudomonadota bacterium]|jgi:benzoate/toluate 1,2-dioxygenase beta subunit
MSQGRQDPSKTSHYVTDEFYSTLIGTFTDWQDQAHIITDTAERDTFRQLIEQEARVLDQHDYDAWLDMYVPECAYWVPSTPDAGDPRREIAVMFDDRRRLEDRVFRLRTGYAWSQAPRSRTVRMVSNVEVFTATGKDDRMVRSNFLIAEFWGDETRTLTGWAGHHLVFSDGAWKFSAKQVNLIDCDQSIRNPSIIL